MIEVKENYDLHPICPYCSTEMGTIHFQQLRAFLGKRYIYFCPHCRKILGVSHRKGFWMG